jgi:imidazolonepropionase-like amidohydrolase
MSRTLFTNVNIFDGTSKQLVPGEVLVDGDQIEQVALGSDRLAGDGAEPFDGAGATLMPGLVNTHCHVSFTNFASIQELAALPVEEHVLRTAFNATLLLDSGFTALVGAAAAKPRLDVAVRNAIEAGYVKGPRFLAASPELTVTGGFGDSRSMHSDVDVAAFSCDGAPAFTQTVRRFARDGVDLIKFNISGDGFGHPGVAGDVNPMTGEEIEAICDTARRMGCRLAAHAHADEAVNVCIEQGVEFIYHATFVSDATIEALERVKDHHYITPAIGVRWAALHEGAPFGLTPDVVRDMGIEREVDAAIESMNKLREAGIKVLPFGDYGLAWTPQGTDARDFEHFVNLFGFEPWEVLRAATAYGGEAFGGKPMGQIKTGYLADLILVDGDPLADLRLLQDRDRLVAIMLGGEFHKRPIHGRDLRMAAPPER